MSPAAGAPSRRTGAAGPRTPAQPGALLLLDTASLYFRAFYGIPDSVTAPDGSPVNAVRGLLDMTAQLVRALRPTGLVACWDDDWRPAFRVAAVPSYKAHRLAPDGDGAEAVPDALGPQVPVIAAVLEAFGFARVGVPGCEADDVIGTLVTRAAGRRPVDVVTGDRDLFQLVDDAARVRVLYTARGVREHDVIDQAQLQQRYGVRDGAAYADYAVLRGDASDGLPGVKGVGEKTAADLLRRYGDLAGVRAAARAGDAGLTRAQRTRLLDAEGYLDVAPAVVRVVRDAPVPPHDDALPTGPADPEALVDLTERWGLASSVERVLRALAEAAPRGGPGQPSEL